MMKSSSLNGQKDLLKHGVEVLVNRNVESLSVYFLILLFDIAEFNP